MKIQVKILILSLFVLAVVIIIRLSGEKSPGNLAPGVHQVKVKEVIHTSNYTYVRVRENRKEYWCAINKADIEIGKTYFWLKGWEMNQFHSKELDRNFSSIFFLEALSDRPIVATNPMASNVMAGRQSIPEKEGIKVDRAEGGITIGELYASPGSYNGKSVTIRGEVVKFSPHIMNRNWVHIQDGTKEGNDYDLTITTQDTAAVGATCVFEGIISLDKDFGSGYSYAVIMEGARIR